MKKLCMVFLLSIAIIVVAHAQNYESFKFGFALGASLTGTEGYGPEGGIFYTLEPAFRVSDDLAIGFRFEAAATRVYFDFFSAAAYSIVSYTVNGQYYLSDNRFRPFVGAGLGIYKIGGNWNEILREGSKFGFYPRVGFDLGHFSVSLDYNLIPMSRTIYLDNVRNNYLGLRMGFFIGGGKKKYLPTSEF